MADKNVDFQGSDNSIPLSPQWLLPKPGENRTGVATGENHFSPLPVYSNSKDIMKLTGAGDDSNDNQNKKDVFRPSIWEVESGRRDRWRDEERDTNSSVRKDRWRDGEKEHLNNRRMDRWADSSGKQFGDGRRVPGERWADSASRESHDQRWESKWNTRWGPDDKEADAIREKWGPSNKEADTLLDKGSSQPSYHVKDERDGDHYRPWRSNSSYSRGRADPHHQASTPNKQAPTFSHGQGRGENPAPTFPLGRVRVSSTGSSVTHMPVNLQVHGLVLEKGESGDGEPHSLKYGRTKLIDIYRKTDMRSYAKFLDAIVPVPSLTQEESVEPLAFCSPTPEESVILKGIDKGDIMSSGAPQISKDGSAGRITNDFMHSRRNRLGSRDNLPDSLDDSKYESVENAEGGHSNYSKGLSHEKQTFSLSNAETETTQDYHAFSKDKLNAEEMKEDSVIRRKNDDISATRESSAPAHAGLWRSSSLAERSSSISRDRRELSADFQKDLNNVLENSLMDSPNTRKGQKWQMGYHPFMRRQTSAVLDREMEAHQVSQQPPEDLVLYYKDPQGEIRGPFAGSDIISWFEGGYFGLELQVRLASAPPDATFSFLGDVMPHLRSKARAPPGFSTPKPNETQDASGTLNYANFGKLHAVPNEVDVLKARYKHGSTTEAENRFLESLMAGSMNTTSFEKLAPSEGMQGYGGNNSNAHPLLGSDSGDDAYLLAKKMALERQRSLSTPYSFWPGRDAASTSAKTDLVNDTSLSHSMLLSSIADNAHPQNHSQNVSLMSVLQGLPERTTSIVNNGISGLLNFPVQGGLDPLQDKLNMHHSQNFHPQSAIGIQQQRLQLQNPSLNNLLAQSLDNQTNILTPEKLLASGLSQDQMLSLLQQQYMLQLQSQAPGTSQQLSLLDKMLLLKQHQKQEEQQQLLHQQQQLLLQMLSEQQPNQQFGEQSFLQLQTGGFMAGNANVDHAQFQPPQELFQMGAQLQASNLQDENANASNNLLRTPSSISEEINRNVASETSVEVQHRTFNNEVEQRNWDASMLNQIVSKQQKVSSLSADGVDTTPMSEMATKYLLEQTSHSEGNVRGTTFDIALSFPPGEHLAESVSQQLTVHDNEILIHENVNALTETSAKAFEEPQDVGEQLTSQSSPVKQMKISEAREGKKPSEKRSKKQKASKVSTDSIRGVSKPQQSKSESEGKNSANAKSDTLAVHGDALEASVSKKEKKKTNKVADADVDLLPGNKSLPATKSADDDVTNENKGQPGQFAYVSEQTHAVQQAWKPAPGFKPKSLLEIQQEEQRRAQEEMAVPEISTSLSSMSISTPWAGVSLNSDNKALNETHQDANTVLSFGKSENSSIQKSKKSQVEDLFWDDVAKSVERETEISDSAAGAPSKSIISSQIDSVVDDDFIEAKDTKKSRKKSSKVKSAGGKVMPAASLDASVGSSPFDKGKNTRQIQQEKEVLPAVPSGPSLGDFVVWKGESTSPSPAPAWSIDSGKPHKPASLRDILKEQEKKVSSSPAVQVPTPQKPATNKPARGSGPSRSFSSSSPAKAAFPIQIKVQASSHGKHKVEDDLFWGPLEQAKPEAKQSVFPQLGTQSSWGGKSPPVKGTLGGSLDRQKSIGGKPVEFSISSSASSAQKGKNASTKHSEAMDFKEWCENECIRLLGSKDTSFLEFCLKQSREEAEILLVANLGSFDPDHKFILKFLDYKDFLPADVLEVAFKNRNDQKATASEVGDMTSDFDTGNGTARGGKKKGKKGKKVSPSVLGFNVVSNRIMMGEIQTVDD